MRAPDAPGSLRPVILLVALAAILLEIAYTRVFSYKLHYYFTYLTIGVAMLGLGSGGVFVAVLPRLRAVRIERLVPSCCLATAVFVPVAYLVVAGVQLNASEIARSPIELATLVLMCTLVFVPFLLVGLIFAAAFSSYPEDLPRLYFADLLGAGLGCALSVPLFGSVTPPGTIMLGGAMLAAAAAWTAGRERPALAAGSLVALALLLVPAALPRLLPDPVVDSAKTNSPQRATGFEFLFSRWSTVFRVDVIQVGDYEERLVLSHDGNMGSGMWKFDGDLASVHALEEDPRSLPFSVLGDEPEVLIIGAAGGHEILASLYYGAARVTGVELNPVTVSLLRDHFADYSGRIAEHDRVELVNAEGRSFLHRDPSEYDLIWLVAPDSYANMNAASSGAFVLSESYIYTREMIVESLGHLRPGGILALQIGEIDFARKPNRTARYLATARAALQELGLPDFERRVLVATTRGIFTTVTILLGREPIEAARIAAFRREAERLQPGGESTTVWHPRADGERAVHPTQAVIDVSDAELDAWIAAYPYDVTPVSDDAPFFWHFTGFMDALFASTDRGDFILDPEDAKGERVLVALLCFVAVYSAVFLLLPLFAIRDVWRRIPAKRNALLYFGGLGLGFMFFEISLIQKLALFLGHPTYSLSVTLFAVLVFSGLGSLASGRYSTEPAHVLPRLLGALAVLTLFYLVGMDVVVDALIGRPFAVRAVVAVLLLAPLGLCLGAFMPIGLRTLASLTPHGAEYVAWAWAVNGFFSVVSSVLATMVSMTWGFGVVLLLALAVYGIGVLAMLPVTRVGRAGALGD